MVVSGLNIIIIIVILGSFFDAILKEIDGHPAGNLRCHPYRKIIAKDKVSPLDYSHHPSKYACWLTSQRGFGHETTGMRNVIPLDIECQSPDRLVAKNMSDFQK